MDYHVTESRSEVLKQQEVPLYDPSLYDSKRFNAMSRDGKREREKGEGMGRGREEGRKGK